MSLNEYCFSINAIFDLFVFSFISIVKIKVKLQVIRTLRDKIQSRGEFFGNNVFLELFFKVGAKISEFRKIRPRTHFYCFFAIMRDSEYRTPRKIKPSKTRIIIIYPSKNAESGPRLRF